MTAAELRPTTRGLAAVVVLVLLVTIAIVTGTLELVPLAVAIGVPLVVAPLLAHRRAHRALVDGEFHADVEPGTGEVGGSMRSGCR